MERERAQVDQALRRSLAPDASEATVRKLTQATQSLVLSSYAQQFYVVSCFLKSIGEEAAARSCLALISLRCRETEFGAAAHAILMHSSGQMSPEVGQPFPALDPLRSIYGARITLGHAPRLIVFASFTHDASLKRVEHFAQACQKAGLPADSLVVFALESDAGELARISQQRQLRCAIVAGQEGFANPTWVRLDVRAVPQAYLLDREGIVRARDLTPDRLAPLLATR
jgi:hypothetical protein